MLADYIYNANSSLYLSEDFVGFVNATGINEGTIVFYSQPRLYLVQNPKWHEKIKGVQPPTIADNSYIWLEPISGMGNQIFFSILLFFSFFHYDFFMWLAVGVEVKLQVNFYIPPREETNMFNVIYKNVPTDIMYPLTWTQQEAMLGDNDAADLQSVISIYFFGSFSFLNFFFP